MTEFLKGFEEDLGILSRSTKKASDKIPFTEKWDGDSLVITTKDKKRSIKITHPDEDKNQVILEMDGRKWDYKFTDARSLYSNICENLYK